MEVTAAVARHWGAPFSIERLELDEPRPDEICVRIVAAGLCHTDLIARDGAFPFSPPAVLGHEGAGVVEHVGGNVTKVSPGDRVMITFRSCGTCHRCRSGHPAYCESMPAMNFIGHRLDGSRCLHSGSEPVASNFFGQSSFATYCLAYERNVIRLDPDVPFEIAAPLGCGVQTGAGAVMRALACEQGSSLLITGGGAVGLSAVMGGVIQGCSTIIVSEVRPERRALALELGATHTIDPATALDLTVAVREILKSGVDYAVDTTARNDVLNMAVSALAPKGALGLIGAQGQDSRMPGDIRWVLAMGLTIRGIIEGDSDPETYLPELIDHWRAGRLSLDKLIRTYPLAEINAAVEAQHRGECVKAVLCMPTA